MAVQSSKTKSSWAKNAAKSMAAASVASFKKIAPNISDTGTGLYEGGKKVRSTLKPNNLRHIARDLGKNKYYALAKKTLNTTIKDIKKGNLYNEDRAADSFGSFDMGDDDFGDGSEFSFGNDDSDYDVGFALSAELEKNSEATVAVGNAIIDTTVGMSSAVISELQSGFGELSRQTSEMNASLKAILDFHNENTREFYEKSLGIMQRMVVPEKEESWQSNKSSLDIFTNTGSLDRSKYKDFVKKRIKATIEGSPVGMVATFLKDDSMLEMMLADPVGMLSTSIISSIVPGVMQRTVKEVDRTLGEFIPNMLGDLGKWANIQGGGAKNTMKRLLGSIFGYQPEALSKNIATKEINKDKAEFDNITRNAITEILPKYARESTSYLREIAMHLTKKSNSQLLESSEIFDATRNRYVGKKEHYNNLMKSITDDMMASLNNTSFGSALVQAGNNLSEKDRDRYSQVLNRFILNMINTGTMTERDYNTKNKNSKINQILKGVGDKQETGLLRAVIQNMYDSERGIGDAFKTQQKLKGTWNEKMRELGDGFDINNLIAHGINSDTDIFELLRQYQSSTGPFDNGSSSWGKKKKKKNQKNLINKGKITDQFGNEMDVSEYVDSQVGSWQNLQDRMNDMDAGGAFVNEILGPNFGKGFKNMGKRMNSTMHAIMKGDSRTAMLEIGSLFTDQMKGLWEGAKTHFIEPLADRLFGKDADGNAVGLFAGVQNKLSDTYKLMIHKINGKAYKDSKGNEFAEDTENSLVGMASNVFKDMKASVKDALFGHEQEVDENGNVTKEGKVGLVKSIKNVFSSGLNGWKEAIFGEGEDADKEIEKLKKDFSDGLPKALGNGAIGGIIGTTMGSSLLGTLIGGPVAGAAIGFAGTFLSRSDKFKDYFFGPEIEDEDGNVSRAGGIISAQFQKAVKDNKSGIITGGVLGAIKGMVFPGAGLLTTLVGGPIAGAAVGAGVSMIKKSKMFEEFLYGTEDGKEGIVTSLKKFFGKKTGSRAQDEDDVKAIGMGATGAAAGAITAATIGKMGILGAMATPAGPLGGAVVGAAIGIAAGGKKFAKMLFGEKDEDGKRKGGLLNKFGNMLHTEFVMPLRSKVLNIFEDAKLTFKHVILERIALPFRILGNHMAEFAEGIKTSIQEQVTKAVTFVTGKILSPVLKVARKLFDPVKKVAGKVVDIFYNSAKAIVTAPFKILRAVGKFITSPFRKFGKMVGGWVKSGVKKLFGYGKALINAVTSPFRKVGSALANKVKNTFGDAVDRIRTRSREGGGIKGKIYRGLASLTSSEWRKGDYENQAAFEEGKRKNKDAREKRRILDYNRILMARTLGYDAGDFTEANMNAALQAAKEKGKKIHFKKYQGGYDFDETAEDKKEKIEAMKGAELAREGEKSGDISIRQYSEQYKTNQKLDEILNAINSIDSSGMSDDENEKLKQDLIEDARKMGFDYDPDTNTVKIIDGAFDGEEEQQEGEKREEESGKKKKDKYSINFKEGWKNSWLHNKIFGDTTNLEDLPDNPNDVSDALDQAGRARKEGGRVDKGEAYLVGDGGTDPQAKEIFVPSTSGKIFAQGQGGIKVHIVGVSKQAAKDLGQASMGAEISNDQMSNEAEEAEMRRKGAYDTMKKAIEEAKAQKDRDDEQKKQTTLLEKLNEGEDEHHNLWADIFSKKGLLTMGAIAVGGIVIKFLPQIIKGISWLKDHVWETLKGTFSRIADFMDFFNKNDARTNGMSMGEQLSDTVGDLVDAGTALSEGRIIDAAEGFILDDGRWDANSGGRVNFLARRGLNLGKKAIKVGEKVYKVGKSTVKGAKAVGTTIKSGYSKGSDLVKTALGKPTKSQAAWNNAIKTGSTSNATHALGDASKYADDLVSSNPWVQASGWADDIAEAGLKSADNFADDGVKLVSKGSHFVDDAGKAGSKIFASQADDVAEGLGKKLVTTSADDVLEKGTSGLAKKTAGLVDNFFSGIVQKFAKKFPQVGASKAGKALSGILKKAVDCVKRKFQKIAAKVSAVFGGKGSAAAATAGISEAVFLTLGAINGASGTARLFQVPKDKVDMTMIGISTLMGGLLQTTVGSVIDIVCGLIAEILGLDLLNVVATTLYSLLMGPEAAAKLDEAMKEHQAAFADYKADAIEKEYETQKAAGIIGAEVSLEQFQEGVGDGTYSASTMSFQDWNADTNQSFGYKIGKGFSSAWKGAKKFFGSTTSYTDENGQQYIDNGDGTYKVIGADGTTIGNVTSDAVDTSGMEEKKKTGAGKTLFRAALGVANPVVGMKNAYDVTKWLLSSKSEEVYSASDGSYYTADGKHYNANGEELGDTIDMITLSSWVASGILNPEERVIEPSGYQQLMTKGREALNKAWTGMIDLKNKAVDALQESGKKIAKRMLSQGLGVVRFLGVKEKVWVCKDGSGYFKLSPEGEGWVKCNNEGDVISETISPEDMHEIIDTDLVVQDTMRTGSGLKENLSGLWDTAKGTVEDLLKTRSEMWNKIGTAVTPFMKSVKENGLCKTIFNQFKKTTTKGWYLVDGSGYYLMNNSDGKFEFYTMNGDRVEEKDIDKDEMQELIDGQLVTMDTVELDTEAQKAIKGIKSAVADAWKNAKETVSSRWTAFKNWLNGTGGGGTVFGDDSLGGSGGRGTKKQQGGFGGRGTANGFAYYSQNDSQWKDTPYVSEGAQDGATMGDSGCGPTAMAMVASQFRGKTTPTDMAQLASASGFRDHTGTNERFIGFSADSLGLQHTDTKNPSADYIRQRVSSGSPMVLNGIGSGAFTKDGHYVVAVGADEKGNILVNDPRGESYSKAYSAEQLARGARKAWSFGGAGPYVAGVTDFRDYSQQVGRSVMNTNTGTMNDEQYEGLDEIVDTKAKAFNTKYGDVNDKWKARNDAFAKHNSYTSGPDWLSIVKAVKAAMAEQQPIYWTEPGAHMHTITIDGKELKVRPDCSGIISAMLWLYGGLTMGENLTSSIAMSKPDGYLQGFHKEEFPGWDACKAGDILTTSGHVEIFSRKDGNTIKVYNGGSTNSLRAAGETNTSHKDGYTYIWRPDSAGTGSNMPTVEYDPNQSFTSDNNVAALTQVASNASDIATGKKTVTTTGETATKKKSSLSWSEMFSKAGSIFSKFADKAMTGLLTGNWDFNFNDDEEEEEETTSAEISEDQTTVTTTQNDSSSSSSNNVKITGDTSGAKDSAASGEDAPSKIWNHLRGLGLSPEARAGVMGCWEAESGNNPNRVEGDYMSSFPGVSAVLNDNQTMDDYVNNKLFPALKKNIPNLNKKGYEGGDGHLYPGMGLAQWTGPRHRALFDFAKSKGLTWHDLDGQLAYFDHELETTKASTRTKLDNATSVEEATRSVLDGYEMGEGFSQRGNNATKFLKPRIEHALKYYNQFTTQDSQVISEDTGSALLQAGQAGANALKGMGGRGNSPVSQQTDRITPVQVSTTNQYYKRQESGDFSIDKTARLGDSKTLEKLAGQENTIVYSNMQNVEALLAKVVEVLGNIYDSSMRIECLHDAGLKTAENVGNATIAAIGNSANTIATAAAAGMAAAGKGSKSSPSSGGSDSPSRNSRLAGAIAKG